MPLLHWLTRDVDIHAATHTPYRLLEQVPEYSHGDSDTGNMLIQGDNLDALKALLPYYAGKVKCIYADPPFNTKQAFPDYDDNLEHTIWLALLYPLLELQRDLLSSDGTLFVHIDDNELGYLIAIADEIFGRKNRVAVITFKQGAATGHKSINPGMVSITNFLVVYSKDKSHWNPNKLYTARERDKRYGQFLTNPLEHFSAWNFTTLTAAFSSYKGKKITELKKSLGAERFEDELNTFVIAHASQVVQPVRPSYDDVSEAAQKMIDQSRDRPREVFYLHRPGLSDMYFQGGKRIIFYREKLKEVDGALVAGEPLTTLWDDLLSNNLHAEGGVEFPKSKKPEALIKRLLELSTSEKDLVLDAFLGSGTTAAVAQKMRRHYIGIERGEHSVKKCLPRMRAVVDGEQTGISKAVDWQGGGGFLFYKLGLPVFDENGHISTGIRFEPLAAHLWFVSTGIPYKGGATSPFLGEHEGVGYYLLYNGILGDLSADGGNVLTGRILASLPKHDGQKVIFGESCRLGAKRLQTERITFRQIPYEIKAR
ncbi:MAG TPA: site-specific DNA-methyltransferase [Synechococcales bacterium UBA10510]|nr:site-specific DNA-methyltransferase [Synechococcales bacterium UBA10510]